MNEEEVQQAVHKSLDKILEEDSDLLRFDVNERSITHRLGLYLQQVVGDAWDVDVEYNRIGSEDDITKRIPDGELPNAQTGTVYPDVIIHKRGIENRNILVIEAKKLGNSGDYDRKKIRSYMRYLDYDYGLFVNFHTGQDIEEPDYDCEWYMFE